MCHGDDSRAPGAPGHGEAAEHGDLVLTSAEGTSFAAAYAVPSRPTGNAVVVMPDVRGLHAYYRDLVVRLAEVGMHAVAIDYFGRTAGVGERADGFDYKPHVDAATPEGVAADVAAAVAHLRTSAGAAASAVFTLGFCWGGSRSWRQSADTPGLAGAMGFYGRPEAAVDVVDRMRAPLLLMPAGADANIPVPEVEAFAAAARERSGVDAEVVVFDGMPHSFFDRSFADHREACDRAWRHILGFVARYGQAVA